MLTLALARAFRSTAGAAILLLAAAPSHGQSLDSLRRQYRIPEPRPTDRTLLAPRSSPSMGASSPSAFGGRLGDVWLGATWTERPRFSVGNDGIAAMGFGSGRSGPAGRTGRGHPLVQHRPRRILQADGR